MCEGEAHWFRLARVTTQQLRPKTPNAGVAIRELQTLQTRHIFQGGKSPSPSPLALGILAVLAIIRKFRYNLHRIMLSGTN